MARKEPAHKKKKFKAQRIFTDREEPRELFDRSVKTQQTSDEYQVLNFHGVGGQGKTALCEQFQIALEKQQQKNQKLGFAKLDFEIPTHRLPAEGLLSIRLQLGKQCKIPFPAFDTAFSRYFSFAKGGQSIHDAHPELFSNANDVLKDIESVVGDLLEGVPGAGLFYKYGSKLNAFFRDWWQKRGRRGGSTCLNKIF